MLHALRERGILTGTDAPYRNLIEIPPPIPLDAANAARLVDVFDGVPAEG